MYFFFHLLAGTILGFFIGDLLRDPRWVLPCALGAVLPDLIDKPLGLMFFPEIIGGDGRIYGHTVLAVLVLCVLGLLVLQYWKTPVIIGIAIGVMSHQVLDSMWLEPANWLYPAYGAFPPAALPTDVITLLGEEIKNPLEIFLFVSLGAGITAFVYRDRIAATLARHTRAVRFLLVCGVFGFCILTIIFIGLSRGTTSMPELGGAVPDEFIISGVMCAMAAFVFWRWYRRAGRRNSFP
jgi:inner membrane protein